MTGSKFASLVRELTRTNSTTLTDATLLLFANPVKDELARRIVTEAQEDYFGVPQTADLVEDQREYPFPPNMLARVRYVEANLGGEWIALHPFDLGRYNRTTNEAAITEQFGNIEGSAFYDIFRNSLWIYSGSIEAVNEGLKLWAIEFPADINTSTLANDSIDLSVDPTSTTSGMPREVHEIWAEQTAIRWKETRDKPIPLTQREMSWEVRAHQVIKSLAPITTTTPVIRPVPSGSQTWNEGADL